LLSLLDKDMNSFIKQEIDKLVDEYRDKTTKSQAAFQSANKLLVAGNTRNNLFFPPYPPYIESGKDCYLYDLDGNQYIDFLSDFTVAIYGHSNQRLAEKTKKVLASGTNFGGCITAESNFADALKKRFTSIEKVRFANSGTEANLYALSTALAYSNKSKVIVFEGNYHGGIMNYCHKDMPINAPFNREVLPYNDINAFEKAIADNANETGAVIMELMMNSGGCIPAQQGFVDTIRNLTQQYDIPLIIDEVMTARLGYHGLQSQYKIEADITSLGKFIGGGFSVGAFGGKEKYMSIYDAQHKGYTALGGSFNNNVFSMNLGATALEEILTKEVMDTLNKSGDDLRNQLNQLFEDADVPLIFTGGGSVMNLHLAKQQLLEVNRNPVSSDMCKLYHRFLLDKGIWIAPRGLISLSIAIGSQELDRLLKETAAFIRTYDAELRALN